MCCGDVAIASVSLRKHLQSFKLTMMFFTFEAGNHLVNEVVYIKEFQLHGRVVYRVGQVVGEGVATALL